LSRALSKPSIFFSSAARNYFHAIKEQNVTIRHQTKYNKISKKNKRKITSVPMRLTISMFENINSTSEGAIIFPLCRKGKRHFYKETKRQREKRSVFCVISIYNS
jgi:hypothetical protein